MDDIERSIGRIEGQMEADGAARTAAREAAEKREHSFNNKVQAMSNQLAIIAQQMTQYGEIKVQHGDLEIRIRSIEAMMAEQSGAGKLRHWLVTVLLAIFGGTLGLVVGRKLGLV